VGEGGGGGGGGILSITIRCDSYSFAIIESEYDNQIALSPTTFPCHQPNCPVTNQYQGKEDSIKKLFVIKQ
jgi:hypothetical protein